MHFPAGEALTAWEVHITPVLLSIGQKTVGDVVSGSITPLVLVHTKISGVHHI